MRSGTGKGRTSGKGSDSGITRCHARSLGRQVTVGSAGSNNDPMRIVASFLSQTKSPGKSGPSLKTKRVTAGRFVHGILEVVSGLYQMAFSRRWRVSQGGAEENTRQLRWSIEARASGSRLSPTQRRNLQNVR